MVDPSEQVKFLALNWHRDENGRDTTQRSGVSVGAILTCVFWQGFSSIFHYYTKYQKEVKQDGSIWLPSDSSRISLFVAHEMELNVVLGEPCLDLQIDEQFVTSKNVTPLLGSRLLRVCQSFFKKSIRGRELFYADWVTKPIAISDPDVLMLYKKSLLRSAVPVVRRSKLKIASEVFPEKITEILTAEILFKTLEKNGIIWPDEMISIATKYCHQIYAEIRPALITSYAVNQDLLEFYQPTKVNLPADAFETWILIYELCKLKKIKTCMYIDGYMPSPTWPVIKTSDNKDWLVDEVAAYGRASASTILKTGFPQSRIKTISPPFADYYKDFKSLPMYQAMILTWIPNTVNPSASYGAPQAALRSTLQLLISLRYKSIAIKLKTKDEESYVLKVLAELGIEADLLYGRLHSVLHKSEIVIGGMSTALAECAIAGIMYYVYEPMENGYTEEMINNSSVVNRNSIARDSAELEQLIRTQSPSWIAVPPEPMLVK